MHCERADAARIGDKRGCVARLVGVIGQELLAEGEGIMSRPRVWSSDGDLIHDSTNGVDRDVDIATGEHIACGCGLCRCAILGDEVVDRATYLSVVAHHNGGDIGCGSCGAWCNIRALQALREAL